MILQSKAFRFMRNTGVGLLGNGVIIATNLFCIPFFINRLGLDAYGLFILMNTGASYGMMLTLGSASAIIKFVAEFGSHRNDRGVWETLRYTGAIYGGAALFGGGGLWLGAPFIAESLLQLPAGQVADGVFALRCGGLAVAFLAFAEMGNAALYGLHAIGLTTTWSVVQNVLFWGGVIALVSVGRGLREAVAWYVAVSGLVCGLVLVSAGMLLAPGFKPDHGAGVSRRSLAKFVLSGVVARLASLVSTQIDRVLIARNVSLTDLTLYVVPNSMLQRLQPIRSVVSQVLFPMMSETYHGESDPKRFRRMYFKSTRFILWTTLPILVFLFAVMPQFLGLWLGQEFTDFSVKPARLLILAQVAYFMESIAPVVLVSTGKPVHTALMGWVQALVSLACWLFLIGRYQILGVAMGALVGQCASAAFGLYLANRRVLKVSWGEYFGEALLAPAASAVIMLAVVFPLHALASSWTKLALLGALGCAVYYGSTWFLMSFEDRKILRDLAGLVRRKPP